MYADEVVPHQLTERIIGCAFTVANTLGVGFLEKVYENALALESRSIALSVEQQRGIDVKYKGALIGQYVVDLLMEESVEVELKATRTVDSSQFAQCRNYLKATGLRLCLLINFGGPWVEIKRIVSDL